ncbi:FAD-binding domain-containing protein [Stipitochalara longipes BDJ]|nr:FAD-binding domain-containing protein [Stipitochalara longipes BDJ]
MAPITIENASTTLVTPSNVFVSLETPSNVFVRGAPEYAAKQDQHAFSTYPERMDPKMIVYAQNVNDIKGAILYAKQQGVAVAIRSGGHQYMGASSTTGENIQLDLSHTFKTPGVDLTYDNINGTARASVSHSLAELNTFLHANGAFVPHGNCAGIHLGGHVQTGGYGQMGRSFGLFGDHVTSLEIVDHEAKEQVVSQDSNPALFKAILGGSPGNFCVIKHFTLRVHRDSDYTGSVGLKCMFPYSAGELKRLLTILAEMSDDQTFDNNYDLSVNVVSSGSNLESYFPNIGDAKDLQEKYPEQFDEGKNTASFISVHAQWVPFKDSTKCDFGWFQNLENGSIYAEADANSNTPWAVKSVSELSADWLFPLPREFDYPYINTTRSTNATDLVERGWPQWMAGRIDEIVGVNDNGCFLSVKLQNFGGEKSAFRKNKNNGTSYSWRDATVVATVDCFYAPTAQDGTVPKETAQKWHEQNEKEAVSSKDHAGKFTDVDQRVLWGSFGNFDLDSVWEKYYDNAEMYRGICEAREKADPEKVFTPNTFCVAFK